MIVGSQEHRDMPPPQNIQPRYANDNRSIKNVDSDIHPQVQAQGAIP